MVATWQLPSDFSKEASRGTKPSETEAFSISRRLLYVHAGTDLSLKDARELLPAKSYETNRGFVPRFFFMRNSAWAAGGGWTSLGFVGSKVPSGLPSHGVSP